MKTIEQAFERILHCVKQMEKLGNLDFYDAYVETMWNLIEEGKVKEQQTYLLPEKEEIENNYKDILSFSLSKEEWRNILQLVLLKGVKEKTIQANHQMTPDGIGFLFVYLIDQLSERKEELEIFDNAVGMGNLLYTVQTALSLSKKSVKSVGLDVDETLLSIAEANAAFLDLPSELYLKDGLSELAAYSPDFVVSEPAVGFYPFDERASEFSSFSKSEHTYAHHLLMQAGMRQVKEGGFGLFLLPTQLLSSKQAGNLKQFFSEEIYLQAILHLPEKLFREKSQQKSIFILQKRGGNAKQQKVLAYPIESLKEVNAIQSFSNVFKEWKRNL